MGQYLRISPNEALKVGGKTLPGIISEIRVQGDLNIDEHDLENTNLKTLAVLGFTTQRVQVTLALTAETQGALNQQVRQIQGIFQVDRVKQAGAKLVPMRIVSPHTDARRLKVVTFKSFLSWESGDLEVSCVLVFEEFESDVARMQERVEQEEKRRAREAEEKDKKDKKDKDDFAGAGVYPEGQPPGGGKGTAGGSSSSASGSNQNDSSTNGTPAILRGFADGSATVRGLVGR